MAGSPKRRAELTMLADHEERIFEALDEGKTQAEIAAELGVMRSSLSRWLNLNPSRKQALADARSIAAEGMAEETLAIADNVKGIDNAEVQAAKLRIETRMKLAAVWNPEKFGERQGVTVNIGTLHLDALRSAQAAAAPLPFVDAVQTLPTLGEAVATLQSSGEGVVDVVPVERDEFGLM